MAKTQHYALKAGHEHSFILDGVRVMAKAEKGHTVPLTASQLANFQDKFEREPTKEPNSPTVEEDAVRASGEEDEPAKEVAPAPKAAAPQDGKK